MKVDSNMKIMAFDIESTGYHDMVSRPVIIGIGGVLMDSELNVVDKIFLPALTPDVKFEPGCWSSFWSKHTEQLEVMRIEGKYDNVIREVARKLYDWINECDHAHHGAIRIVSDNPSFDIHHLSDLVVRYVDSGAPFTHILGRYKSVYDTNSILHTVSMSGEYGADEDLVVAEMEKQYDIPASSVVHDHNPVNDAITIARSYWIVWSVYSKKYNRRSSGD